MRARPKYATPSAITKKEAVAQKNGAERNPTTEQNKKIVDTLQAAVRHRRTAVFLKKEVPQF